MTERIRIIYVTADSHRWIAVDTAHGLVTPPYIDLHQPHLGPVRFYDAESYRLPVPAAAKAASG